MALISETVLRERIRDYMKTNNISQVRLALQCGASPQYISDMLRGSRPVNETLAALVGYVPAKGRFYISKGEVSE